MIHSNTMRFAFYAGALAVLLLVFGHSFPQRGDLVAHFLLVNEIMTHGYVRAAPVENLGAMALYPPGAHWLAALVGWVGGSGLVGIVIVSIASVYALYLLVIALVGSDRPFAMAIFAVATAALIYTRAQVGWELGENFFYPQLVGDLIFFGLLLWLAENPGMRNVAPATALAAVAAMYVQPIVALHILGTGCVLVALRILETWADRKALIRAAIALLCLLIAAALILRFHPAFRAMLTIAEHDGDLEFRIVTAPLAAFGCAILGCVTLHRVTREWAGYTDTVIACAALSAATLIALQYAALHVVHLGSAYAIKKHVFIATTLSAVLMARLIGSASNLKWKLGHIAAPVIAAAAAYPVLSGFTTPLAPAVRAISYAQHAVQFALPSFTAGQAVDMDDSQSQLVNLMITMGVFEHRYRWFDGGDDPTSGVSLAMVKRTATIDSSCPTRHAETADYVMVDPACTKIYTPGTTISFEAGGNAALFTGSGWGLAEPWGMWSSGDKPATVTFVMPANLTGQRTLTVDSAAFVTKAHPSQPVEVSVNGVRVAQWDVRETDFEKREIQLPAARMITVSFRTPNAVSPSQVEATSTDRRVLGLAVRSMTVQ